MTAETEDVEKEYVETIAKLEDELAAEQNESTELRGSLESLEQKIGDVESRLDKRLEEALERAEKAETQLTDQSSRIKSLGDGREQSMLAVNNIRDELRLVTAERDRLRQQLTAVEGMQTETATFDNGSDDETGSSEVSTRSGDAKSDDDGLPSIEELMANLSNEEDGKARPDGIGQAQVESGEAPDEAAWKEMIAPEMIVAGPGQTPGAGGPAIGIVPRKLIAFGEDETHEYLIDQELMTIGRSESADIKIEGNFISRIHARLLMIGADIIIEDAGSKNGINVNSEKVERHVLQHGDLVRVGSVRFRFVDDERDNK